MKQSLRQVAKLFYRNIFLVSCYGMLLLLLNVINLYLFSKASPFDALDFLQQNQNLSLLVYLFFMVFSFEYYAVLERCHLRELHQASFRGEFRFRLCQSVLLAGALLLLILNLFGWETAFYVHHHVQSGAFFLHVVKNHLLNFLLPGIAACMIGYLLANHCKRLVAYLAIILLALVGVSPVIEQLSSLATVLLPAKAGILICRILDLFILCPRSLNFEPDYAYGIPMEQYRWLIAFFAVFLLAGLIILSQWKRINRAALKSCGIVLLAAAVTCMSFSFVRGSVVIRDYRPDGEPLFDQDYYVGRPGKVKPADFTVTNYQMKLAIRDRLKADVVMKLEAQEPRTRYSFTLHHSMQVQSVEDALTGTALDYTRDTDYLDIHAKHGRALSQIRIVYEGFSPTFYTNTQGIRLPGTYAYYPMEGYHIVYDGNYNFSIPAAQKRFDVQVETPDQVISNLPMIANNQFAGESEGLTLVTGFYQERRINETRVCDALLNPWTDMEELKKLPQALEEFNQLLGTGLSYPLEGKAVFQMGSYFGKTTAFSDHIAVQSAINAREIAASVVDQTIPLNVVKNLLRKLFISDLRYGDILVDYQDPGPGYETEFTDLATRISRQINALGEGPVYRAIYQYLIDETDQRPPEQFIESLSQKK